MSCGFSVSVPGLSTPEIDVPELPPLPAVPDYSSLLELGLPIPTGTLGFAIPEVDVPDLPPLPAVPDYSLAAELGLPGVPPYGFTTPEIDVPALPAIPTYQVPDCPFDDVAA